MKIIKGKKKEIKIKQKGRSEIKRYDISWNKIIKKQKMKTNRKGRI